MSLEYKSVPSICIALLSVTLSFVFKCSSRSQIPKKSSTKSAYPLGKSLEKKRLLGEEFSY